MDLKFSLLLFVLMLVMREIDFNDSGNVVILRIAYGWIQVLLAAGLLIVFFQVRGKHDTTQIRVPVVAKFGETVPEGSMEVVTVRDYDLEQLKKLVIQLSVALAITALLHMKWGFTHPLFFQCFINPYKFYESPLTKLHILGHPAKGALLRPWPEEKPFGDWSKFEKSEKSGASGPGPEKKKAKEEKENKKKR
eukprot:RCo030309